MSIPVHFLKSLGRNLRKILYYGFKGIITEIVKKFGVHIGMHFAFFKA